MSAARVAASEMAARCAGVTWRPEASISPISLSHSADATGDKCAGFPGAPNAGGFLLFFGRPMMSFSINNLPKTRGSIRFCCNKL